MIVVNQMGIQALRADASQIEPYVREKDNFPLQCGTLPLPLGQMLVTGCCPSSWLPLWWLPPSTPRNARSLQCHPGPAEPQARSRGQGTSCLCQTEKRHWLRSRGTDFTIRHRYADTRDSGATCHSGPVRREVSESSWEKLNRLGQNS